MLARPHATSLQEVASHHKTHLADGLAHSEVLRRLAEQGNNQLPTAKPTSALKLFARQFLSLFTVLLFMAAAIAFWLNERVDAGVIVFAILIHAVAGFLQEYRAQKAVLALRSLVIPRAIVVRDGSEQEVPAIDLVPGDLLLVREGDRVAADARLIEALSLTTGEAVLTGESQSINKHSDILPEQTALADRRNMIFAGTAILRGRGRAVVTSTGRFTELGRIAEMLAKTIDEPTPLTKNLNRLARLLTAIVVAVLVLFLLLGLWRSVPAIELFETAIATAVAVIPEGLLVTISVTLAIGIKRLSLRKAIISKAGAAEALGSATVIATDKTGTLTEGSMKVVRLTTFANDGTAEQALQRETIFEALRTSVLCNDAEVGYRDGQRVLFGDSTETALLTFAEENGIDHAKLLEAHPRQAEIPFDFGAKFMATAHKLTERTNLLCVKGAPEVVLSSCTHLLVNNEIVDLTPELRKKITEQIMQLSTQGLRNLGLAKRILAGEAKAEQGLWMHHLVFLGIVSLEDPIRLYVQDTIQMLQRAGIALYMISGDHALTARAIARKLGLPAHENNVLTGEQLAKLSDAQLQKVLSHVFTFARVTPEDKVRIVTALKERGEIVAMTGDGVNDAPALKTAHIGIAVGSGTELAKETAQVVLLDDNLSTIAAAVEEGRVIFDNIKKVLLYLVGTNFGEVLSIVLSVAIGLPLPLLATQILWVNLVSDGAPDIALASEVKEDDVMLRKPRAPHAPLINKFDAIRLVYVGSIVALVVLLSFVGATSMGLDIEEARTAAFTVLVFVGLLASLSYRSLRKPLWRTSLRTNRFMLWSLLISLLLQFAVVYVPFLQAIFGTVSLSWEVWVIAIVISVIAVLLIDLRKALFPQSLAE